MKENNIIQNLGLNEIQKFQNGGRYDGFFGPMLMIWDAILNKENIEKEKLKEKQKKNDTVDTSSRKSKTASTGKKSTTVTTRTVTTTSPQSSTSTTPSTSNMDWMSEYGSPQTTTETTQQEEIGEREPFSAIDKVWNDDVLSKVDTAVASRYLRNSLQDLLNMYNMKVAETIGQKRG